MGVGISDGTSYPDNDQFVGELYAGGFTPFEDFRQSEDYSEQRDTKRNPFVGSPQDIAYQHAFPTSTRIQRAMSINADEYYAAHPEITPPTPADAKAESGMAYLSNRQEGMYEDPQTETFEQRWMYEGGGNPFMNAIHEFKGEYAPHPLLPQASGNLEPLLREQAEHVRTNDQGQPVRSMLQTILGLQKGHPIRNRLEDLIEQYKGLQGHQNMNLKNSPEEILEGVESGSSQVPKGGGGESLTRRQLYDMKRWSQEKSDNAAIRASRDNPVPDFQHDNRGVIDELINKEQLGTASKQEIEKLKNLLWERYTPQAPGVPKMNIGNSPDEIMSGLEGVHVYGGSSGVTPFRGKPANENNPSYFNKLNTMPNPFIQENPGMVSDRGPAPRLNKSQIVDFDKFWADLKRGQDIHEEIQNILKKPGALDEFSKARIDKLNKEYDSMFPEKPPEK